MKETLMAIMKFASEHPDIKTVKILDGHTNEWVISPNSVKLKKTTMGRYYQFTVTKDKEELKIKSSFPYAESWLEELLFYLTCDNSLWLYSCEGERIVDDPVNRKISGLYGLSLHQLKILAKQENATPPKQHPNTKRSWVDAIRRHRLRQAGQEIPKYLTYYN